MYRTLSDLRILHLAVSLEDTLERYEENLRNLIPEVVVRAKLRGLFEPGPSHEALREAYKQLSRKAGAAHAGLSTDDVLQTLLECESLARDFYLNHLDRLSDPGLVRLFRQMAAEEEQHVRAVMESMNLAREPAERARLRQADRGKER